MDWHDRFEAVASGNDAFIAGQPKVAPPQSWMAKEHGRWRNKRLKHGAGHVSLNIRSGKRAWVEALAAV